MIKNIVILGANSAIAQEVANSFNGKEVNFFLVSRNEQKLEIVKKHLLANGASKVFTLSKDLSKNEDHVSLQQEILSKMPTIDFLLLAQGTLPDQTACESDSFLALKELNNNFNSLASLLLIFSKTFQKQNNGNIAVITSVAGDRGRQSNFIYGSAKGALSTFLSGLRNRLSPFNVNVLDVRPGFTDTPMTASMKKNFLFVSPKKVGSDIAKAVTKGKHTIYTPSFWCLIMLIIKNIPEFIFKKLKL